jgi:integrase/recombinase XerD
MQVGGWPAAALGAGDLTPIRVEQLMVKRRVEGRSTSCTPRAMRQLVEHLRRLGVVPPAVVVPASTPAGVLVERYSTYLERRRLSSASVRVYVDVARGFLSWQERLAGGLCLEALDARAVGDFVLEEARRLRGGSVKCTATRLRAFLRFLFIEGEIEHALYDAVPSVASWRQASLVKALEAPSVARLLSSCDRRTRTGRRDFAILTLLSRLGLRAGEVAQIQLSDVDWRAGELLVRGKGSRRERLPLPSDVGEALGWWLHRGRRRYASAFLFTSLYAPHGGLQARAVDGVVRRACERAGLPSVGAHRLRHTAATEMLRAGANLAEVGQVLRHRSHGITSIYAKVDRGALSAVVQPWPGVSA